jgi:hypothetical protein
MATKRAHQVDGWMDGQTDATRTILLPQLSAQLKMMKILEVYQNHSTLVLIVKLLRQAFKWHWHSD